jgi:hypothetical protein
MDSTTLIVTTVFLIIVLLNVYILIRNSQVFDVRTDMLVEIRECIYKNDTDEYKKLNTLYNKYSYEEMLFKIWKSPKSFYRD